MNDYDRLGQVAIDAIIEGGMIEPDCDSRGHYSGVLKWNGNAAEQIGEALRREVRARGIRVSAIYPGGVETEFNQHTGARRITGFSTPRALRLTAEDVARVVYRVARKPRATSIIPWPMQLAVWVNILFPGLLDRVIERRFVRLERGP